ncbi:AMP-binding protein [Amaricoccus macauensis]|uniref:AMP-binding protein n=1 Tax=Amaricoccus macauensis TaxID=57001 RepID=UPI003C7C878C
MRIEVDAPPHGTVRDWIDHRAETTPDGISHLFADGAAPLTWAALREEARGIAGLLYGLGARKGESVALMLPNGRPGVLCLFGALYGGFRATLINLVAGADAIGYALEHSGACFTFVGVDQQDLLATALAGRTLTLRPIQVDDRGIAWPERARPGVLQPCGPRDDALLMYTSGTTGRPKGVIHSHASLLAGGWTTAIAHELEESDRALCVLPFYHINGLCVTIMGPLVTGGSVVVCERFSARRFWRLAGEHRVTWFSVVPTIISHLLHGAHDPDQATRNAIRFGRSASSALSPDVHAAFEARFDVSIVETMGLTETAAQILSNPLPSGQRKVGSPGRAYGNEVAILTSEGIPAETGTEGEIAVRGPNVMKEYFRNPDATAATITADGWLRTGDLGRMDADGYVFVTGRLKELIIKGGENIAPREVDEALYSHPDIVEAAAFARPCVSMGERVEAAVKLRNGSGVSAEDLIRICQDRLGTFKSPEMIHFMEDLPKGPSGKIQRMKLAELTALPEPAIQA